MYVYIHGPHYIILALNLLPDAHAIYVHGGGSAPVNYASVFCTGRETQFADCPVFYTGDRASAICSHYSDAGVKCPSGEQLLHHAKNSGNNKSS